MLSPIYRMEIKNGSIPYFPRGATLSIQKNTWEELQEGALAVFCGEHGHKHLGRVRFQGEGVRLESLDGAEPLLLAPKDLRRVERVIGVDYP